MPIPSAGKAKLDLVLGTVSDVYASTQQVSLEMPLDRLMVLVTQTVARIVATFNALGLFKKG